VLFNNRGAVLQALKRFDEALASYTQAIALKPDYADAFYNRGVMLQELKRFEEALACYDQVLVVQPNHAAALNNRGGVLWELKRFEAALASYERVLAIRPNDVAALNNRGAVLRQLKRFEDALASYDQALVLQPDDAETLNGRGDILRELKRFEEAIASYNRVLAVHPENAAALRRVGALVGLSAALSEQGKSEDAIAPLRQALALKPDYAGAHHKLGHMLRGLGRLEEARHAYQQAIKLAPEKPRFYMSLAVMKRFAPGDADFAALEQLAADPISLPVEEQIALGFALGKAYEDLGEYERSFRHLLGSNALRRQRIIYNEAATLGEFARIRKVFTPALMREKRDLGDPSPIPVFIIGMPRSGTTLIEQILASHPRIFGAGEQMSMPNAVRKLESGPAKFPEAVPSLGGEQLRQLGVDYIAAVQARGPNAERITDKMPHNYLHAGLIHLALPNARIIHTRRDPIDTCLSCFSKRFGSGPYSYDLAELGRYYRAYEALMVHWRKVLAPSVMLEVQYEDVIADLEGQARRVVAHCGLEWDDACLSFHETQRTVHTASAIQVRQPIYRTSIGRSRPYAHLLGLLIEALRADPGDPGATNTGATHDDESTSAKSALASGGSSHLVELPTEVGSPSIHGRTRRAS